MTAFEQALTRLDDFVARQLSHSSVPGLALALTDRERTLHVAAYGVADVAARTPLTPDTLFDIASIGKWFTAVALLQQHEAGRLDLRAPVKDYLLWFELRSRFAPITAHHLLSHTAGLATAYAETPGSRYDTAALAGMEAAYAPGSYFHYSNTGYKTLGFLLEALTGRPRAATIKDGIFDPLGMAASAATVTQDRRERMAVGYTARYDDRPARGGETPLPATWTEFTTGDGGGVSTAADLVAYARMILNRGQGPGGRILSPASFDLMARPVGDGAFGQDLSYGYGTIIQEVDGHTYLGHGGGAPGYQSAVMADMDAGVAVAALINHGQGALHIETAHTALLLLRAVVAGSPLPPVPPPRDPYVIADAADYAGLYRAPDGAGTFALEAAGDRLILRRGGDRIALERRGPDLFYVDHPDFALFLLRIGRADGRVVEAFHGPNWYIGERYAGATAFAVPAEWAAYPGHYRSHNPWVSNFRVVRRKDALLLVHTSGGEEALTPLGAGVFRVGASAHSPERLCFDTVVDGQALRACLSEEPYYRALVP